MLRTSNQSSAGNTRGLIEAGAPGLWGFEGAGGLPRGIPAASLKRDAELRGCFGQ